MAKIKIKVRRPWIAYPGSTIQQSFGESVNDHGYLLWDIKSKTDFTVDFARLPNPSPFVTLEWSTVKDVLKEAKKYPEGTRFRIRSQGAISQKDVKILSESLRANLNAHDVSFKVEEIIDSSKVTAGDVELSKEDLLSSTAQMRLMKEFYKNVEINDDNWKKMKVVVDKYLQQYKAQDETLRNVKWTLKSLEFDNLFAYGEGNKIAFDKLNGITGIFGRNKIGKSSLVGAIMYALYNATDRGPINSYDIINEEKPRAAAKAVISVNGVDYVITRETEKHENRKKATATTSLKIEEVRTDGSLAVITEDARTDTDKKLRSLIGTSDDFLFTSLSSQGDITRFIKEGATQRKLILSKFLGLDIFESLHEMAKEDFSDYKSVMKNLKQINWDVEINDIKSKLESEKNTLNTLLANLEMKRNALTSEQMKLATLANVDTITTQSDVTRQKSIVDTYQTKLIQLNLKLEALTIQSSQAEEKLRKIEDVEATIDTADIKRKIEAQRKIQIALANAKHQYQCEAIVLDQQEKSAKRLLEVPCGEQFPSCKFISNAHIDKAKIREQKEIVDNLLVSAQELEDTLQDVSELEEKLGKVERLMKLKGEIQLEISSKTLELANVGNEANNVSEKLTKEQDKYIKLEEALSNTESTNAIDIKREIENLKADIVVFERQNIRIAQEIGRLEQSLTTKLEEKAKYDDTVVNYRLYELVTNAFSKKGIPNLVINRQLPIINNEISNIMNGLFDFNVELESDVDSNAMDIYMNFGARRRPVENGSGMEKMISSLVIRVALSNISSMPRPDFFIIDEGFGVLDPFNIEACNRLLSSLKRFYRNILIITHTDAVKDTVDGIIEVIRANNESKVVAE